MSRVGKKPVELPSGVKVTLADGQVAVEGPKGKVEAPLPNRIQVEEKEGLLLVSRKDESKRARALHGLTRSLIANAVSGVTEGFQKCLDLVGIGYRAEVKGRFLNLSLGFSHPIDFPLPEGIEVSVQKDAKSISNYVATIKVTGVNKAEVGQVAANIRRLRPVDAYKGKGFRYVDEIVRLKVGKKGA